MMDKKDKLSESLGKNLPAKVKADSVNKEIQDDYEFSRETYKDLIETGKSSIDVLAELARDSEHPRAFEVLSQAIKNVADTTDKLMSLQKNKKELHKEEKKEEAKQITNNNVFVGSTTDLQRLLQQQDDDIIDVEHKE